MDPLLLSSDMDLLLQLGCQPTWNEEKPDRRKRTS
jgi:hypothetical protein